MKRMDALTYLNVPEILDKLKEEPKYNIYTEEEITQFLEEGKIRGVKLDGEWYANQCDAFYFFNASQEQEVYAKSEYGGAIGVDLTNLQLNGKILDIGGGGEGIIGQLKGDSVIAIDSNRRELEEAPEGGLKIEMDGKDLKFLDHTYDTVTSFFTLMYIPNTDHKKILEEAYRVLKPNGEFLLWDINIPECSDDKKEFYLVYLEVKIPDKPILTGFGTRWPNKQQNMTYFKELGESIGFKVKESSTLGLSGYTIRFIKD